MARRMIRKVLVLSLIPGFGVARSDLIVTLSPMGPDGQTFVQGPSGSVAVPPTGTIDVEVRLSVDGADDPLDGATFIQFDFNSTGDSITVSSFRWLLNPAVYGFRDSQFPSPFATATVLQPGSGLLQLTGRPVTVATFRVAVRSAGTLDAVGMSGPAEASLARVDAGISTKSFSPLAGNLTGGVISLTPAMEEPSPDPSGSEPPGEVPTGSDPTAGDGQGGTQEPGGGVSRPGSGGAPVDPLCGAGTASAMMVLFIGMVGCRFRSRQAR